MQKTVITAPRVIQVTDAPIPKCGEGEVLVRMLFMGVCASDVQVYHGKHRYVTYPLTQGHEGVGEVVSLGAGVTGLKVGDKVCIEQQLACNACFACRQGRVNVCENLELLGITRDGLFTEYITVPQWNAVPLPADMPLKQGAFVEPVSIAVNAARKGGLQAGSRCVILGAGMMGYLVAQVALSLGARVLLTDIQEDKLVFARERGVTHCVNTRKKDLKEEIAAVFGTEGVHAVFDCAATPATFDQALTCANKASTFVIVGNYKQPVELDVTRIQRREIAVQSVMGSAREHFLYALQLLAKGLVNLNGLIEAEFPLEDLDAAYRHIDAHPGAMKVLLHAKG